MFFFIKSKDFFLQLRYEPLILKERSKITLFFNIPLIFCLFFNVFFCMHIVCIFVWFFQRNDLLKWLRRERQKMIWKGEMGEKNATAWRISKAWRNDEWMNLGISLLYSRSTCPSILYYILMKLLSAIRSSGYAC